MEIGETVVFIKDVQGVGAGKHGRVAGFTRDSVIVGCRVRERLEFVRVEMWDVLSEEMWGRLMRRRQIAEWEKYRCKLDIHFGDGGKTGECMTAKPRKR
jgi:hypothetical protein